MDPTTAALTGATDPETTAPTDQDGWESWDDDDDDCEGRCGRQGPPPPPLLTDDLVIAATERRREPALPDATVEAALTLAFPTDVARFDLIRLPAFVSPAAPAALGDPGQTSDPIEHGTRLLAEFARRGHRILWFADEAGEGRAAAEVPASGFPADQLIPLPTVPSNHLDADEALLAELATGRREREIAAAVVWLTGPAWTTAAARARARWGWRIVYDPGPPPSAPLPPEGAEADAQLRRLADIVLTAPAATTSDPRGTELALDPRTSWPARWAVLDPAVRGSFPKASVIVVTYDNLAFTRLCVASLLANTEYPNWELIVVDNGSRDGTPEFLRELMAHSTRPRIRAVFNPTNRGFGPANNQGLAIAGGDILVLLNNDTIVPRGWLSRLAQPLADPRLGLVGPSSNRTCNEAQVEALYETYGAMRRFAAARGADHDGELWPIRMLAMFCTAFRRDVLTQVGFLDERYEQGMFEDEDYALRVAAAGYGVAWTPAAYVHHAYHASIGKLLPTGEYQALFRANQARFEEKWGICWERHRGPG